MKGDRTRALDRILKILKNVGWEVSLFLFIALSALSIKNMHNYANAISANDTVTISVNVSQVGMVDINPSQLSWQNVPPGGVGTEAEEESGYEAIWIENIGSTNITAIWFNSTFPSSFPFGSGDPKAYDAGNFVVISNDSANYYFVNRVEYPENDSMYVFTNKEINESSINYGNIFGRFRNNSFEYFWEFNSDSQTRNCSKGVFYISDLPKTKESTGDADLRDNTPIYVNPVQHLTDYYGVTNVTIGGHDVYCVTIPKDCSYVMFHRWNADVPGADSVYCSSLISSGYFVKNTYIYPGGVAKAFVRVYVPFGVPYGPVKDGTLTVYVETD